MKISANIFCKYLRLTLLKMRCHLTRLKLLGKMRKNKNSSSSCVRRMSFSDSAQSSPARLIAPLGLENRLQQAIVKFLNLPMMFLRQRTQHQQERIQSINKKKKLLLNGVMTATFHLSVTTNRRLSLVSKLTTRIVEVQLRNGLIIAKCNSSSNNTSDED